MKLDRLGHFSVRTSPSRCAEAQSLSAASVAPAPSGASSNEGSADPLYPLSRSEAIKRFRNHGRPGADQPWHWHGNHHPRSGDPSSPPERIHWRNPLGFQQARRSATPLPRHRTRRQAARLASASGVRRRHEANHRVVSSEPRTSRGA